MTVPVDAGTLEAIASKTTAEIKDLSAVNSAMNVELFIRFAATTSLGMLKDNLRLSKEKMERNEEDVMRGVTTPVRHAIYACELVKRGEF